MPAKDTGLDSKQEQIKPIVAQPNVSDYNQSNHHHVGERPAHSRPSHLRLFMSYLVIGLLSGVLGAAFYGRFVQPEAATNSLTASKQVTVQEQSAIIDLAKKVSPSVVSITSSTTTTDLFGQTQTGQGAGTGIIVTSDGLILTNKHVVSEGSNFTVITSDGKQYKNASILAKDPTNDIAFVKIDAKGLKVAELGDSSKVEVGQTVVAIGNALGQFQNSVTSGIISGRRQSITAGAGGESESLSNLLQTDAAINPGNSGGPLVNIAGQVIGINTAIAGEGAQNIGFAIPINDAKNDISAVESQGKITRAFLGVRYVMLTKDIAAQLKINTDSGAYVQGSSSNPGVVAGGPADKAGLKDGDIITKVNDKSVDGNNGLASVIGQFKDGDKVKITYTRNGKTQGTTATLQQADS